MSRPRRRVPPGLRRRPQDLVGVAASRDPHAEAQAWAETFAPGVDPVALFDQAGAHMREMSHVMTLVGRRYDETISNVAIDTSASHEAGALLVAMERALQALAASPRFRICPHVPNRPNTSFGNGPALVFDLTIGLLACGECIGGVAAWQQAKVKAGMSVQDVLALFGADDRCDVCAVPAEVFTPVMAPWAPDVFVTANLCRECAEWLKGLDQAPGSVAQ